MEDAIMYVEMKNEIKGEDHLKNSKNVDQLNKKMKALATQFKSFYDNLDHGAGK